MTDVSLTNITINSNNLYCREAAICSIGFVNRKRNHLATYCSGASLKGAMESISAIFWNSPRYS